LRANVEVVRPKRRIVIEDGPSPIDVHVGERLRQTRLGVGMSQEMLADGVGVSFQQVQKYEHGTNRISASRLYEFSRILGVPIAHFFAGIDNSPEPQPQRHPSLRLADSREARDLAEALDALPDAGVRSRLAELIRYMARDGGDV
jgi:transcriptional regulator with XRE-family HTH domain